MTEIIDLPAAGAIDGGELIAALKGGAAVKVALSSLMASAGGDLVSLATIAAKVWSDGEARWSSLYGGSLWIARANLRVQDGYVTTSDELHVMATANTGFPIAVECQAASIMGHVRGEITRLYVNAMARLRRRATIKLAAFGDSKTFGQFDGGTGAVARVGSATNFGDGSTHAHDQLPLPWPAVLEAVLQSEYGAIVTVDNRGYSGDRTGSAYLRHLSASGIDLAIFALGVNDALFAASNGANPLLILGTANEYSLDTMIAAYRKLIVRQVLRGSAAILVSPGPHASLTGYDGTAFAAARILRSYAAAVAALGAELGVPVLREEEMLAGIPLYGWAQDGIHFSPAGADRLGKRVAALLVGQGWHLARRITGEAQIGASLLIDPVEGFGSATTPTNTGNATSFAVPWGNATDSFDMVLGNGQALTWSFCVDEEAKAMMPVGRVQAPSSGTTVLTWELDYGLAGGEAVLDVLGFDGKGDRTTPPVAKTVTVAAGAGDRWFNAADAFADPVQAIGPGWHTLRLRVTAGTGGAAVISGVRWWSEPLRWRALTLLGGASPFGRVEPAYAIDGSVIRFRGSLVCATPTADTALFDIPAAFTALLPGSAAAYAMALDFTPVRLTLDVATIKWLANNAAASGQNIVNLAGIAIPLLYKPSAM